MSSLAPVLSVMARVLMAFSLALLVPLVWAWFLDGREHAAVWGLGFVGTAVSGWLLLLQLAYGELPLLVGTLPPFTHCSGAPALGR